jgi:mRNA-degrading endonuclease RelE of RelBE toxin-antitoxin system
MARYRIQISNDAEEDLDYFQANDRRAILEQIIIHLADNPLTETNKKKKLRDNQIAPWELKYNNFRIFYTVEEKIVTVVVISAGEKDHNDLYIRGIRVDL